VSGRAIQNVDPFLAQSFLIYRVQFTLPLPAFTNLSTCLSSLAIQHVQNYDEHIATNLKPVFCRLLKLNMTRNNAFHASESDIEKLANHIFKILGNMQTLWPPSVAATVANEAIVATLVNRYQQWFEILESQEALEMWNGVDYDYNPDNHPAQNEVDEEFLDEEIDDEEFQDLIDEQDEFDILHPDGMNAGMNIYDPANPPNYFQLNQIPAYENVIRKLPSVFIRIFYNALSEIERIKDSADGLLHHLPEPITEIPSQWFYRKCMTKLSKSLRGELLPINFTKKLFKKVKKIITTFAFAAIPMNHQQANHIIDLNLANEFNRIDPVSADLENFILNEDDIQYLKTLINKTSLKIRNDNFQPKLISAIPDTKMSAIVPMHSFMRRHISINRQLFKSLLDRSGFEGVPDQQTFRQNDNLAAHWYWEVFDFIRMKFNNFQEFRGLARCFDFLLVTDGYGISVQFTRPDIDPGPGIRPQDVGIFQGDKTFFVDPGRTMSFTAMQGLSGVDADGNHEPVPIIKLSSKEYYHITGFNRTRQLKHNRKAKNFKNQNIAAAETITGLESEMPTSKTMNVGSYITRLVYLRGCYQRLVNWYDTRYNKWNFQNYVGRQKMLCEVYF
jgi:hypothetical protein